MTEGKERASIPLKKTRSAFPPLSLRPCCSDLFLYIHATPPPQKT